jgi:hypothetical protein
MQRGIAFIEGDGYVLATTFGAVGYIGNTLMAVIGAIVLRAFCPTPRAL